MADDDTPGGGDAAESGAGEPSRRPRTPPTIELKPSRVETSAPESTAEAGFEAAGEGSVETPVIGAQEVPGRRLPPLLIAVAALSGAGAALLVGIFAWWSGQIAGNSLRASTVATIETMAARIARLEEAPSVRTDPALAERIEALEKAVLPLRDGVAAVRGQTERLAQTVNDIKAAPAAAVPSPAAPTPDLSPLESRVSQLEQSLATVNVQLTQLKTAQDETSHRTAETLKSGPAADQALRRAVVAAALDSSVRNGEPYVARLRELKAMSGDANELAPLEVFAAHSVPTAAELCGELLVLLRPATTASSPVAPPPSGGLIERLKASALRLVSIRRSDEAAPQSDNPALARVIAAARANDLDTARREIVALPAAERNRLKPSLPAWLDKVAAREVALTAAREASAQALSALSKSAP